jgi:hypothetical protein
MVTSQRADPTNPERQERSMTLNRKPTGSFVVVSLDHANRGAAEVQAALASLDIPVEVVESGRRLRWNTAVVLRIPEQRMAEAMLALGMKGFSDVVAYQSSDVER